MRIRSTPETALLTDPVLARLALTARECEVLRWLAAGRPIATLLLAISVRAVHKHTQRIYTKRGVETRTAAVMRALQAR